MLSPMTTVLLFNTKIILFYFIVSYGLFTTSKECHTGNNPSAIIKIFVVLTLFNTVANLTRS